MIDERRWAYLSFLAVVGFALFRAAVMGTTGLGDSESYYWAWSQRPALSYYDHPPMVAWLIWLSTSLGGHTPFLVRLPSVILFTAMGWLLYRLSYDLFRDARVGFYSILTFNLIPVFAIGAIQMVPDIPSAVCFTAYILILNRLLRNGGPGWLWYILGVLLGLGTLSKYFAIMLVPGTVILAALVPEYRFWFRRPEPYIMGVIALFVFSPVLIWNYQNEWPSFRFHLAERHGGAGFNLKNLGQLAGGQLLYVNPLYLAGLLWAVFAGTWRAIAEGDRRYAILAAFSGPVLLFFYAVCAWTNESEPHWPAFGYITAIVMMSALGIDAWERWRPEAAARLRGWYIAATALAAAAFALFFIHVYHPILPIKPKYDITNELYGWDRVGSRLEDIYRKITEEQKEPAFALAHHWVLCSQMMFSTGGRIPVHCMNERTDQFDFWDDENELVGKTAVVVTDLRFDEIPQELYRLNDVEKVEDIRVERGGEVVRKFTIWIGRDYTGLLSKPPPGG
ncbi:MAG: ArnT family glycosyltransferase [Candidatus Nitrospinota bacterium M3_3B_026]